MSLLFASTNGTIWPFDGTVGVLTINEDEGIFTIPTDLIIDQRVNGDGGVLVKQRRSPRRVVLSFFLEPVDATNILTLWSQFFSALAAGGSLVYSGPNGERELRQIVLEGPDRSMTGRDLQYRDDGEAFTVSLLALDPYWYGPVEVAGVGFISGTSMVSPSGWDDAISWDAVLPWDGGSTFMAIVTGDVPASPQFFAAGNIATLVFSNGTRAVTLAQALGSTDVVTVDSRVGHRGPHVGTDLLPGAPVGLIDWTLITQDSQLFDLPVGSTSIIYSATGTDGFSSFGAAWESRWLTP